MGIRNVRQLAGERSVVARGAAHSQRNLAREINIHGLSGTHVPAGRVRIPTGEHPVMDFYLMNPATKGLVREWVNHDRARPFVGFAMETRKSPFNPGMLHVVQQGADANHMEWLPEAEMIANYDLDADQGHLELVGRPIDVLSSPANVIGNSEAVMTGLNFFEQIALAAFLNRETIQERAAAHLGAFHMVSEAQIVHAGTNHQDRFTGQRNLPGMPEYVGHWTRDLYDSRQLDLSANHRVYARRVWRGGIHNGGGALPVADRDFNDYYGLHFHNGLNVARFAVLPLPQDSNP